MAKAADLFAFWLCRRAAMCSWVSSPRVSSVPPTSCLPQSTACSGPLSRSTRHGAPTAACSCAYAVHTPYTRHAHSMHSYRCLYAMLHATPGVLTTVWSLATTMTSRSEAWATGATSRCCPLMASRHGGAPTGGVAPLCETSTRICSSADWPPGSLRLYCTNTFYFKVFHVGLLWPITLLF